MKTRIFEVLLVNPAGLVVSSQHVRATDARAAMNHAEGVASPSHLAAYTATELSGLEAERLNALRREARMCAI